MKNFIILHLTLTINSMYFGIFFFFFMCSLFIINIIMGVRAYAPFAVTIKKNKF
jgi:hypothetical protein